MCQLEMGSLGHIAFDGAKLKANASIRQTRDEKGLGKEITRIEAEIKNMLERAGQMDQSEDGFYGKRDGSEMPKELISRQKRLKKLSEAKVLLEAEKLEKVNLTDKDSQLMKDKKKVIESCYNGQLAVDEKKQVIVAADVVQETTEHHQLVLLTEAVEENEGMLHEEGSADAGYSSYDNLEYVDDKRLDMYMPDNFQEALEKKNEEEKRYDKSRFEYDKVNDIYWCPEGKVLSLYTQVQREGQKRMAINRGQAFGDCLVLSKCTKGKVRTVIRDGREPLMEAMREKLKTADAKKTYQKRMYTVEPVFGNIQGERGKITLSLRGKVKVIGEWLLMCLVHNIRKIVKRVLTSGISLVEMLLAKKSCFDRMALAKI